MSTIYAPADVLWGRVLKRITVQPDGCWLWQGAVTSRGYGCIGAGRKGKNVTTHRLAVIARDGSIPDGLTVDHLCHNASKCDRTTDCPHRRCVNPDHLDVCTAALNGRRARCRHLYCDRGHLIESATSESGDELVVTRSCACGVESTYRRRRWSVVGLIDNLAAEFRT